MIRVAGNTVDPDWDGISRASYNSWMRNGETGARRLDLPIVDATAGTTPIDLIRRPRAGDPTGPGTPFEERFFRLASVRILLSDTAAEITGLPTVTRDAAASDLSTLDRPTAAVHRAFAPIADERQRRRRAVSPPEHAARHGVHQDRAAVAGGRAGTT